MAPSSKRRRKPKSVPKADDMPNLPKSFVMADQVLNFPELLEAIVLQLPMRDMQLFRRVSKQWQATVDNSLPLKRALFKAPGTRAELASDVETYDIYAGKPTTFSPHPHFGNWRANKPGNSFTRRFMEVMRAPSMQDVFLMQPPSMTAEFEVIIYKELFYISIDYTVTLEANETFGSLYDKVDKAFLWKDKVDEFQWYWHNF
ncbi:hypothetical protein LTR17_012603 [Elasticomyces elasticus]|nr:hypothetical protein LTR17_012603 [Elasticomyces elasticus]